jgi:hypothetical protein
MRLEEFVWEFPDLSVRYLTYCRQQGYDPRTLFEWRLIQALYVLKHETFVLSCEKEEAVEQLYDETIGPHVAALADAMRAAETLRRILLQVGRKQLKELNVSLPDPLEVDRLLRSALIPYWEARFETDVKDQAGLSPRGATNRLIVKLRVMLDACTALTVDAQAGVIVDLAEHFGIPDVSFEAARKARYGDRYERALEEICEADRRLKSLLGNDI